MKRPRPSKVIYWVGLAIAAILCVLGNVYNNWPPYIFWLFIGGLLVGCWSTSWHYIEIDNDIHTRRVAAARDHLRSLPCSCGATSRDAERPN